jgi:heptosyltransferase III
VSSRCLIVHPGALGDVLLAGPALAHLRELGFRTTLAVTSRLIALFDGSGLADEVRDLESLHLHRLFVTPLASHALDGFAPFEAVVCWLGAGEPAFRANLAELGRPTVVARAVPSPGGGCHVSRHLVESLAPFGPRPAALPLARLRVADRQRAAARTWLAARGIGPDEAIVLQPGAGSPRKLWPGFADLARRLRGAGLPAVALAGPADDGAVESLIHAGVVEEDRVARGWPLRAVAALLSLARVAAGNDSGPTHLAAAVGCPTVAIFGPTDPAVWAPIGLHVRVADPVAGAAWPEVDRVEGALWAWLTDRGTPAPESAASPRGGSPWL